MTRELYPICASLVVTITISFHIQERMQYLLYNKRLSDSSKWSRPDREQAIIVAEDNICEVAISHLPIFGRTLKSNLEA